MAYLWNEELDRKSKAADRKDRQKMVAGSKEARLAKSIRKDGTVLHDKPAPKRRTAKRRRTTSY